jgi:hypothetical protein
MAISTAEKLDPQARASGEVAEVESSASRKPASSALPPIDKIVVAIHGIGSQRRSDTIRSVARRFGDRSCPPLPVMPLGFFSIGKGGEVQLSRLDAPKNDPLEHVGFAEVFWADIPRQVVSTDDTLEETKSWGASLVSRAHAAYNAKVRNPQLVPEDFNLAAGVIDEIVETVSVMERLLTVLEKLGVFKFDLAPLLRDYIGDVQIVTEFRYFRQKIVCRFHSALAQILKRFDEAYPGRTPEIYIVAHSEGTVVSFLGLLEALAGKDIRDADTGAAIPTDWVQFVRGFMTIGSPIDKHIVLWPKMWEGLGLRSRKEHDGRVVFDDEHGTPRLRLAQPIEWRNYYDFGDPIGFQLDTAAAFLKKECCEAFSFDPKRHDFGFSRYWLPGKAHNDYWGDAEVFGHFIQDVVMPPQVPTAAPVSPPAAPASSRFVGTVSTAIPYALAMALHLAAVFFLFKAVTASVSPEIRGAALQTGLHVTLLGLLLSGVTAAARLPRLVKTMGWRWHGLALLIYVAAALPSWLWLPQDLGEFLGRPFLMLSSWIGAPQAKAGIAALLLAAGLVAATGWFLPRRSRWGRRGLLVLGSLMVLAIVVGRLTQADAPAWPVALAGLAFIYLWWLGILVFDLAFVWHRYIRSSVAMRTLSEWNAGQDAWPEVTLRKRPRRS